MRAEPIWATFVATALLLSVVDVIASEADETVDELKRCVRIADSQSRFACYEALGHRVLAADAPAVTAPVDQMPAPQTDVEPPAAEPVVEAVEAAPAPSADVVEAAPTAPPPAPESMPADLGRPKKEEKKKKEAPPEYRAHVKSCRENMDGIWYFTFDNGQVWHQSSRGHHRFEDCDFDATITKDFFGYKMAIDGGRTLRVRRQR